mgnify:CR=1 FL=1
MLITSILGVFLNIVIAWILAGGGCKRFRDILFGVICGVRNKKSCSNGKKISLLLNLLEDSEDKDKKGEGDIEMDVSKKGQQVNNSNESNLFKRFN